MTYKYDLEELRLFQGWKEAECVSSGPLKGVVLACSGGVDSIAMVHLIKGFFEWLGGDTPIIVAHVNYGLRGEDSRKDQELVVATGQSLALKVECLDLSAEVERVRDSRNLQSYARDLRYEFFTALLSGFGRGIIVTAHHIDDLAENFLFRLARGSHWKNLAGMKEFENNVWRPLLTTLTKEDLFAYLTRKNIAYREDVSNAKLEYSRNLIRHRILPELDDLFPGVARRIAHTAINLQKEGVGLSQMVNRMTKKLENGVWYLPLDFWSPDDRGFNEQCMGFFVENYSREYHKGPIQMSINLLHSISLSLIRYLELSNGRELSFDLPLNLRLTINKNGLGLGPSKDRQPINNRGARHGEV